MPRERWLEVLPDYVVHEYAVEERLIDVSDEVAAVLQRVRMRATVLGQDRSGTIVISDFWRRSAGDWRIWKRHSTPFDAGSACPGSDQRPRVTGKTGAERPRRCHTFPEADRA